MRGSAAPAVTSATANDTLRAASLQITAGWAHRFGDGPRRLHYSGAQPARGSKSNGFGTVAGCPLTSSSRIGRRTNSLVATSLPWALSGPGRRARRQCLRAGSGCRRLAVARSPRQRGATAGPRRDALLRGRMARSLLPAGAVVAFPRGWSGAHSLVNRSNAPARYLVIAMTHQRLRRRVPQHTRNTLYAFFAEERRLADPHGAEAHQKPVIAEEMQAAADQAGWPGYSRDNRRNAAAPERTSASTSRIVDRRKANSVVALIRLASGRTRHSRKDLSLAPSLSAGISPYRFSRPAPKRAEHSYLQAVNDPRVVCGEAGGEVRAGYSRSDRQRRRSPA